MQEPPRPFLDYATELGVDFDEGDVERLGDYLAQLLDANTRFNLTAITDPEAAWERHIGDSLSLVPLLATLEANTVIDVGSGGGLPGIPLAIILSEISFTLVEATGKKARFLEQTAASLGLENVTVIAERAETLGRDREQHRAHYDVAIARAVGRLPVLLELAIPLLRIGGHVLAIKGARAEEEVAEAKEALYLLHSHFIEARRVRTGTIVVVEKRRATPKIYPRRPGEPGRTPLGRRESRK